MKLNIIFVDFCVCYIDSSTKIRFSQNAATKMCTLLWFRTQNELPDIAETKFILYMYDYLMCKSAQESYEGHILGGEAPIAFPSSLILSAFWRRLDSSLGAIRANGNAPVSVCVPKQHIFATLISQKNIAVWSSPLSLWQSVSQSLYPQTNEGFVSLWWIMRPLRPNADISWIWQANEIPTKIWAFPVTLEAICLTKFN